MLIQIISFKNALACDPISSFEGPYTLFLYCKFEAYFFGYQLQLNGSCRCQIKHLLGQQISIHSLWFSLLVDVWRSQRLHRLLVEPI